MPLTNEQLEEIEARAKAATPGPWIQAANKSIVLDGRDIFQGGPRNQIADFSVHVNKQAFDKVYNAQFMAKARTDIPALIAHIHHQNGVIQRITEERDRAKRGTK